MKRPVIEVRGAHIRYRKRRGLFRYEDHWALRGIDLVLRDGESLGVVGDNGSGKSTLLRLLARIFLPDRGDVIYSGVRTGLLTLQLGFLPYLSGRDNIFLSGMLLGMRKWEVAKKLEEIVAFAELEGCIDDPVSTYSTGMRARLGFAIVFQLEPDVLLVDEVLGVGDAAFQEKSADAMKRKILSHGGTVVLVSHQKGVIKELCTRAIWLDDGKICAEGRVQDVLTSYQLGKAKRENAITE